LIREGKSYTIDTVEVLQKKYPNHRIYLVVGSDRLLYFEKWQSWKKLLKKVCIVCQNRTDTDIQKVLEYTKFLREHGGRIIFCKKEIVEMSSTEIRKMVANGKDVNTFLQRETQKIIKENNLYVYKNG
ncbi:MAG: nicotinate-nicotinamide nucleotide adenylyltransferase, partial [Oscillospiraceae bacterium]